MRDSRHKGLELYVASDCRVSCSWRPCLVAQQLPGDTIESVPFLEFRSQNARVPQTPQAASTVCVAMKPGLQENRMLRSEQHRRVTIARFERLRTTRSPFRRSAPRSPEWNGNDPRREPANGFPTPKRGSCRHTLRLLLSRCFRHALLERLGHPTKAGRIVSCLTAW